MAAIIPVILCGGKGSRLKPFSTVDMPKPFLPLLGEHSLFQQTVLRLSGIRQGMSPLIAGNAVHVNIIKQQLNEIGQEYAGLVAEPTGKGTAASVVLAACWLLHRFKGQSEPLMLGCPSDHVVDHTERFAKTIHQAAALASADQVVLFGAPIKNNDESYGYICAGTQYDDGSFYIERFHEKPDAGTISALLDEEQVFWNSGMILVKPSLLLAHIKAINPTLHQRVFSAFECGSVDSQLCLPAIQPWGEVEKGAIDTVLLEKIRQLLVVPLSCGWSDVGTWRRLFEAVTFSSEFAIPIGKLVSTLQKKEEKKQFLA